MNLTEYITLLDWTGHEGRRIDSEGACTDP